MAPTITTRLVRCVGHLFFAREGILAPCNPQNNLVPFRTPPFAAPISHTLSLSLFLSLFAVSLWVGEVDRGHRLGQGLVGRRLWATHWGT